MKKILAILLALNAVLLAGVLLKERDVVVHATGGGAVLPIGNGDVNGDRNIDISDAVYILFYLYMGGPSLLQVPSQLPATGQTKCYDNVGSGIACDSADFPGQDGFYLEGCPTKDRFVDNKDDTVTDTCTGLMWQKNMAGTYTWQDALKYCEGLSFAGHDDWRLPNVRELQSIVDCGRVNPASDLVFGAVSGNCWSSSTFVFNPLNAWYGDFYYGSVSYANKTSGYYVRAVRSGP